MRDPKRIERMCDLLKEQWHKYPDQRLGQLLINYVFGRVNRHVIFYQEDDESEERLKKLEWIANPINSENFDPYINVYDDVVDLKQVTLARII